jgi:hypothetical protein
LGLKVEFPDEVISILLTHAEKSHLSNIFLKFHIHANRIVVGAHIVLDISLFFTFIHEPSWSLRGHAVYFILNERILGLFTDCSFSIVT